MALTVVGVGRHTGDVTGRNPHRQVHLAERYGKLTTVHAFTGSLVIVIDVDGIYLCKSPVVAVVSDVVVCKMQ